MLADRVKRPAVFHAGERAAEIFDVDRQVRSIERMLRRGEAALADLEQARRACDRGVFEFGDPGVVAKLRSERAQELARQLGDITLEVQTKLLRAIQEKTFERVGSSASVKVDVRVIAATHRNLEEFVRQGRFREDLYYRLKVIDLTMPPLRDRREDIP